MRSLATRIRTLRVRTFSHLTWSNLAGALVLAAIAVALFVANDAGDQWTVGNFR